MRSLSLPFEATEIQSRAPRAGAWGTLIGWRKITTALLVFVAYYLGAKVGFALTFQPHPVSVLWPPNAILVAALLLTPPRTWWVVLLAALPAHWAAQLQSQVPPTMILCWFISNTCEALIGAGLARYLIGGPLRFNSLRNVGIFCLSVAFFGPFLSSFLDAGFVRWNDWGQGSYWELIRIRFTSNVLAALIVVPVIVTWATGGIAALRRARRVRYLEGGLLLGGLLLVSFVVLWGTGSGADSALLVLPFPFLLWAAVRFGSRGASTVISMVAFNAIWSAAHGHGPFSGGSAEQNALSIQIFLIVLSVPLLLLAGAVEERAEVEAELRGISNERRAPRTTSTRAEDRGINWGLGADDRNQPLLHKWERVPAIARLLAGLCFFEVVFYVAYKYGMAFSPSFGAPFWFPDSVLLCTLLLTSPRHWWIFLLAALPIRLFALVPAAAVHWFLWAAYLNDSFKALLAALLVKRFVPNLARLGNLREFTLFVSITVLLVPAISSLAGAGMHLLLGHQMWSAWGQWFLGDSLANLVLTTPILYWAVGGYQELRAASVWRYLEAALLWIGLVLTSVAAFLWVNGDSGTSTAFLYAPVPFLLWAVVRFGPRGAATGLSVVAFISIWAATHGRGPFSTHSPAENVLAIQLFLLVIGGPMLFLAALLKERHQAERSLRESEERFSKAFHSSPDAMLIVRRRDSCIVEVNEHWQTIFGYERDEAVRHSISDLNLNVAGWDLETLISERSEGEPLYDLELPLRTKSGEVRETVLSVDTMEVAGDVCLVVIIRDLTDRKKAEAALQESEARFRIVADAAPVLIWMADVSMRCFFFNKPWLDFTGRTIEQEMGDGWAEGVHPDDSQRCLEIYTAAFKARQPFVMQYRLRRHDGEYRWVTDNGVPRYEAKGDLVGHIGHPSGEFSGFIGSCMDITESMEKEQALRQSEERMSLAADAANLGMWEWNVREDEIWATEASRLVLGVPSSGVIRFSTLLAGLHEDDRDRFRQLLEDAVAKGEDYDTEYRLVRLDGGQRWMASRGSVHLSEEGKPERLVGISIDVTARKEAEIEARQHREELGHLTRLTLMGEMAASFAHELNQPLSGIVSNASAGQRFIDRGDVSLPELRELLADISSDGQRAGEVVRGIRGMIKKGGSVEQRVNLNEVVTNVVRMMNPDALLHSCQINSSLDPDLPTIEADPIQLQQLLLNLIMNALDAMRDAPASRRKVMIETKVSDEGISVSVRDHGTGIPESVREQIFDQFFTTKAEGLGMGLAIARSIVESFAGTLTAENVESGGTLFQFTLPIKAESLT
jgi:PAS domain S-box-containing protein